MGKLASWQGLGFGTLFPSSFMVNCSDIPIGMTPAFFKCFKYFIGSGIKYPRRNSFAMFSSNDFSRCGLMHDLWFPRAMLASRSRNLVSSSCGSFSG